LGGLAFEGVGHKRYITVMYTTELQKTAKVENLEDPKLLEAFEARVAADSDPADQPTCA
jgi:hypothetical protein